MPEYVSEDLTPYKSLPVHFATKEDMEAFSEFVGQPVVKTSRCIWYPQAEIGHTSDKRYVDEGTPAPVAAATAVLQPAIGPVIAAPIAVSPPVPVVLRTYQNEFMLAPVAAPIAVPVRAADKVPKPAAPIAVPIPKPAITFLADVELP